MRWHGFEISDAPAVLGSATSPLVRSTRRLVTVLEAPTKAAGLHDANVKSLWNLLTREKRRENTQRIAVAIVSLKERNKKKKRKGENSLSFALSLSLGSQRRSMGETRSRGKGGWDESPDPFVLRLGQRNVPGNAVYFESTNFSSFWKFISSFFRRSSFLKVVPLCYFFLSSSLEIITNMNSVPA